MLRMNRKRKLKEISKKQEFLLLKKTYYRLNDQYYRITVKLNGAGNLIIIEARDVATRTYLNKFSLKLYEGQEEIIADNIDYLVTKISINKDLQICADYFNILPFREMKEFKEKRAIERYNKNLSRSPKSKESSPKNRQQISSKNEYQKL